MRNKLTILAVMAVLGWTVVLAGAEKNETNLLATITTSTVTNVVESDNHQGCGTCDGIAKHGWAIYHKCSIKGPFIPATEKTIITNIYTRKEVAINWAGKLIVYNDDTLLVSTTNRYRLVSEWKQE
jgi:hypothetical protein